MFDPTWKIAEEREKLKKPGQHFCDNYGWKLNEKYKTIQRPDKITWVGGTIYRTITPTTHIWLQSIYNPGFHVWIDFSGDTAIVKSGIRVTIKNDFPKNLMYAESDKYDNRRYFSDYNQACNYILNLI